MKQKIHSTKQSITLLSSILKKMHKFVEKNEKNEEKDQLSDIENIIQNT